VVNYNTASLGYTDLGSLFAVRWTGQVYISAAGPVTFYSNSDDGSRLYIDGELLIDNGVMHTPTEVAGTKTLTVGFHDIRLEYLQAGSGGLVTLSYDPVDGDKQVIPADRLYANVNVPLVLPATGHGLRGEYYIPGGTVFRPRPWSRPASTRRSTLPSPRAPLAASANSTTTSPYAGPARS
jgi:hypothetical protein